MSEHYPLTPYGAQAQSCTWIPADHHEVSPACEAMVNMALVGAVVGGSAAAAQNALRMKRNEIELGEALLSTGRTAIASAAATAVAGMAANTVAKEGVLRLSLMFGVGAAVLYGMNRWVDGKAKAEE